MHLLGIDFGKRKIGLAVGDTETSLAEPLRVIRYGGDIEEAVDRVVKVVEAEKARKVVIGLSGGKVDGQAKEFGGKLGLATDIEITYYDEAFSTKEAQMKSMEAGVGQKKRKEMEDAYAAALILQGYLDAMG